MARQIGQYVVKDSRGVDRILWGQEWGSSCGPASCYMAVCSARQSTQVGGEAFIRDVAQKFGATMLDMMVGAGTYCSQLASIMKDQGFKIASSQLAAGEFVPMIWTVTERKPLILNVGWYGRDEDNNWTRTGDHWIVCVGTSGSNAIMLDPWYGLKEVPLSAIPVYDTDNRSRDPATANDWGQLSGWYVRVI